MIAKTLLMCSLLGWTLGAEDLRNTMMDRQSLHQYSLAKCSDGSAAAYFIDKDVPSQIKNVMIFFDNSMDELNNPLRPCTSVDECLDICNSHPSACQAPTEASKTKRDGVWSREQQNNPFADYLKVYLPSCSLDDFSGARGPLFGSNGGRIFFHGRHIFSSLLRDLVANYGIDQAENVVLVGSGSGARGVGHGCDYLSEAIASVNEKTQVKCVLDGPDLTPYWLNDDVAQNRCETSGTEAFLEEQTKQLWGRTDDESCVRDLENELNETDLANTCGMFSRYWKHVQTPLFVISSQWNQHDFDQVTCNVDSEDEDFVTYTSAWTHGVTTLIQVMSLQQPANGWFVPNCHDETLFLATESIEQRKNVQVPLFTNGESKNLFQVLNNWLTKDIEDDQYQAIEQFGAPNEACSSEFQDFRSQPLKKKDGAKDGRKKSAKQRIVPFDPLDDVPLPKGFPDSPPPKPSGSLDNLDGSDLLSTDRFFLNAFNQQNKDKSRDRNMNSRQRAGNNLPKLLPKVSDAEVFLAADQLRRQQAEQQRRRGNNNRNRYSDYDTDFLYYLQNNRFPSGDTTTSATTSNTGYNRNRFSLPYDLLNYRYNLFRQGTRQQGTDAIFDPIDPSTPEFFDYDYDVNLGGSSSGTPTPSGILPEQAVALSNSRSRKARLWRKVYYLQYLRELYRRTYADYYNDYYYGINGNGNYGRLTKKDE